MDEFKWGTVTVLPDGHRLFFTSDNDWVAIADNSGREPQDTTDGVLWLDFDWNLMISSPDNVMLIPIKKEPRGERGSTITDLSTLLTLAHQFEWPLEDQHTSTIYSVLKESK